MKLESRHLVYILLVIVVAWPMISPWGLPLAIGATVRAAYNVVNGLPDGSTVLMIWDVTPSGFMDCGASGTAFIAHLFKKNCKIVGITFVDTGVGSFQKALTMVGDHGKTYGTDYVDLGFISGQEPSLAAVAADIPQNITNDRSGNPVSGMPIMAGLNSVLDFDLVISMSSQQPGTEGAVRQIALVYPDVPMVSACAAGQSTRNMVFLDSGHLDGLVPGLRGSAELELLIERPAYAASSMDAMSSLHLFMIGLLVVGNVLHFAGRGKQRKGA